MSNLIRRDKAIDYFVTNIGIVDADGYAVDDYDERVKIWTERFSGIPSAESERKWIPVTEALPEEGRYLVTRYDYVTKSSFIDILWFEKNTWWNRHFTGDYAVFAWMPLPKPYEVNDSSSK